MSEHDFSSLYAQFPAIITQMPETFTSHQFILELARQNQKLYVEALYSYRNSVHMENPSPFQAVHKALAQHLTCYPTIVVQIRKNAPSKDIFGQDQWCSEWRKVK